jgi:hypothetical protein
MSVPSDDTSPKAPAARPRGWLRATVVATLAVAFVGAAVGFVAFLSQLRGVEIKPARNADGIVVLTGGSSRVSDAMELLAAGYGKRLLISGNIPFHTQVASVFVFKQIESAVTSALQTAQSDGTTDPNLFGRALSNTGQVLGRTSIGNSAKQAVGSLARNESRIVARLAGETETTTPEVPLGSQANPLSTHLYAGIRTGTAIGYILDALGWPGGASGNERSSSCDGLGG